MMGIIRTLIRLLIIVGGVSLIVAIPFLIDHYGRSKLIPMLRSDLASVGLKFEELHSNHVSYAFPAGLSFNGLSGVLIHQERDFKPIRMSVSADSVSIRIMLAESILKGLMPLQLDFRGLIIQSEVNLSETDKHKINPENPSALDYQHLVLENVMLPETCSSDVVYDLYNDRASFFKCLLKNWRKSVELEKVFFEVLFNAEKFLIPVKDIKDDQFILGELELAELSGRYRTRLTVNENNFIQSLPVYGLKLFHIRHKAQQKAWELFSNDHRDLENYFLTYYHYLITQEMGTEASKATQPAREVFEKGQSIEDDGNPAKQNFLVILGRVSAIKNLSKEKLEDKQFILELLSEMP